MINKTSVFLFVHAVVLVLMFTLRFLGVASDYILGAVVALMSMEAIYMALFTKAVVNKSFGSLKEVEKEMAQIREDAFEATKLHQALIYTGHQIKNIQQELDFLKKHTDLKANGNGHQRRPHHPLISHS